MSFRHLTLASLALISFASTHAFSAYAKPCRDAKGKFTKCEQIQKKPAPCRDDKGRFISCQKNNQKNNIKSDMKKPMEKPMKTPAQIPAQTAPQAPMPQH